MYSKTIKISWKNIIKGKTRERALERAKEHVLNNYLAIGILEDFENTLR